VIEAWWGGGEEKAEWDGSLDGFEVPIEKEPESALGNALRSRTEYEEAGVALSMRRESGEVGARRKASHIASLVLL
jgi:hypothetical protein